MKASITVILVLYSVVLNAQMGNTSRQINYDSLLSKEIEFYENYLKLNKSQAKELESIYKLRSDELSKRPKPMEQRRTTKSEVRNKDAQIDQALRKILNKKQLELYDELNKKRQAEAEQRFKNINRNYTKEK